MKEWTFDAAKQAAQEDRAALVTRALAKAHGDGAAAQKAVEAIREVGYTTADAMLTNLGNIAYEPERWKIDEIGGDPYKVADAKGVGGMKGGAMLAAGAMLAMDGLRRGGKIGVAETTAGGALIGARFGGPLGALIGGIAGFAAVRLFIKGAVEKARQKIKDLYGVDIPDKGVLQQIVDTAKQSYGGNLDMAIRTAQIRDLIQLYAMSTGQATKGMPATVHPLDLVQKGGSLYQSPGYSNGTALPGMGGLPTLDSIAGGVASGARGRWSSNSTDLPPPASCVARRCRPSRPTRVWLWARR